MFDTLEEAIAGIIAWAFAQNLIVVGLAIHNVNKEIGGRNFSSASFTTEGGDKYDCSWESSQVTFVKRTVMPLNFPALSQQRPQRRVR